VKGKALRFQAVDAEAKVLTDLDTHSMWDPYGLWVKGPMKGTQLKPLILISGVLGLRGRSSVPGTRPFIQNTKPSSLPQQ